MANYFPLVANAITQRIEELPAGDNLNLTSSNISNVTNIVAVGNIYANNFIGNVQGNLLVPGSNTQVIFNLNDEAGASPNLTFNGTVLNVIGNIISLNANLGNLASANYFSGSFIGDGSKLINLTASNITGTVANAAYATNAGLATTAITAGTVTNSSQPNITSIGILNSLSVSGNSNLANLAVSGAFSAANINLTGNINSPNINAENLYVNSYFKTNSSSNTWFFGNVNALHAPILNLGNTSHLRISGGTANYVLTTDGTGNVRWDAASVSGNPGGNNKTIQYNDNGIFNGSNSFTFDENSNTVTVAGDFVTNTLQIGTGVNKFSKMVVYYTTTLTNDPNQVIWENDALDVIGVDFVLFATNETANARQTSKISSLILDSSVAFNEYSGLQINGGVGNFSVVYAPGNIFVPNKIQLVVSPNSSTLTKYNLMITQYAETF